jgi:putative ABC transport system substrate-binding protein
MVQAKPGALFVVADRVFLHNRTRIMKFAAEQHLPEVYAYRELVEAGGLMSYGPSYEHMHRQAAVYVDKLLKGMKAAELPVERPAKFELVVNLRTAKALGLTVPLTLQAQADEVIE